MDYTELRGKTSEEIFDAVAKDTGVPSQILWNMYGVETNHGANVRESSAGAVGHMQIMPPQLAVMRQTYGEDLNPNDLADSVFMAGKMLKENLQHFGNIQDAVSAYNGGWDKSKWDNAETRNYTPRVLNGSGIAQAMDKPYVTSRADLDAARAQNTEPVVPKVYLNDIEKNAITQGVHTEISNGGDPNTVLDAAVQLKNSPELAYQLANNLSQKPIETSYLEADKIIDRDVKVSVQTAEAIQNQTAGQEFGAASRQFAVTTNLFNTIAEYSAELADKRSVVDKDWQDQYEANRETLIKGLSPYAVMQMDKAINPQEAHDIAEQDKRDQVDQQILNNSGHPMMWGLTAGILDPAGWAVGAGAGKAFTVGKGMSTAARIAKITAGNVLGNELITASLDAMGHHMTPEDYIHAGAFGMVTGVALGGLMKGQSQAMTDAVRDMHDAATARSEGFVNQAIKEKFKMYAGKNPMDASDPDSMVLLHRNRYEDASNNVWTTDRAKAASAGAGDVESIWVRAGDIQSHGATSTSGADSVAFSADPRNFAANTPDPTIIAQRAADLARHDVENTIDNIMSTPSPESQVFSPKTLDPVETGRVQSQYGLDTVVDEEQLASHGSLYKSAEIFATDNADVIRRTAMVEEKARPISDTMGLRSAGNELLSDDNPLAQTLGMTVAEDAAGLSGWRGVTASIKSRMLHNGFNLNIERGLYENMSLWFKENNVGQVKAALNTFTTGTMPAQFYRAVAKEMRSRLDPEYVSSAPRSIQQAANVLERGFQEMGDAQRAAKTLGHDLIPLDSRGYLPQHLDGKRLSTLSAAERRQVQEELIRQARQDFGWDTEFASKKVAEYLNRAEDNATGVGQMFGAAPRDLMGILMRDLEDPSLTAAQWKATMERIKSGAAKHTHKRLEWDLNANITRDDGSLLPLSDLYENNVLSLYKGYSNRVAGDVALAHVGLYGERDIRMVTEALQRSKVGNPAKTIPAWQQVINEIYSRPTASDAGGNLSTGARFVRQYTGLRLLGGVMFPQLAEMANAVSHLGVSHTLNIIPSIPRLYREWQALSHGLVPENSVMASVDSIAGSPLGSEQYQLLLPQVIDDNLSIVDQKSFHNVLRVMGGAQLVHNKFSFMRAVTSVEQRFVGNEIVMKSFRFIREGKEDVALREMGITPKLAETLRAEMDNIAQFDDRGYLKALDLYAMQDKHAAVEFVAAVRRGTGQIIQETFPGETGKWMRSEIGQLLMQFRKFPSVAVEKQMYRQFRKFGFARAVGGVTAAMSMGTFLYYGRAMMAASLMSEEARKKYLAQRLAPASVANGALMYVSALGMTTDFLQMGSGVGSLLDDQLDLGWSNSRGISGQGIGGLIPSLGTLSDVYNYTQHPTNKGALKLLPFGNLPLVMPFMNALKHSQDD